MINKNISIKLTQDDIDWLGQRAWESFVIFMDDMTAENAVTMWSYYLLYLENIDGGGE